MNPRLFFFPETQLRTPYWNLAIEEAISLHLVKHKILGGIRIWRNPPSLVVGLSEDPKKTIHVKVLTEFEHCMSKKKNGAISKKPEKNQLYVARRASGGGTVLHHPKENLNFSLFLNLEERKDFFGVKESYEALLGIASVALSKQDIISSSKGKSDLAVEENGISRKISGNAQFRKRSCLVQHGTLILDTALIDRVADLMPHPPEEPDYRKERTHRDFLTALPSYFSTETFANDLWVAFASRLGFGGDFLVKDAFSFFSFGFSSFRKDVLKESEKLRKSKYQSLEYILNRELP